MSSHQQNNGYHPAKQGGGEGPAVYVVVGWLRYFPDLAGPCQICDENPARFTHDSYGYEGIEADEDELDEALDEEGETGREEGAGDRVGELFRRRFQRTLEAQRLGIYLVDRTTRLCGECMGGLTEGYMDMEYAGAYTAVQLLSTRGVVSCVRAWRVLSEDDDLRYPLLLYTEARGIDELLRYLSVLDV
jgi:hypothetical protein